MTLACACKKDPPTPPTLLEQMPERTEIGAEKLVGIVNDEHIFDNQALRLFDPSMYSWYTEDYFGKLHIQGFYQFRDENFEIRQEIIFIELHFIYGEGTYDFNTGYNYFKAKGVVYTNDTIDAGQLIVTKYDTINNIFSGTFNLNLINYETNERIYITDGWFDIKD